MNRIMQKYFLVLVLVTSSFAAGAQATPFGQVNVSFTITPPYSSKLSDYASIPNKVLLILTSTDLREKQVFLRIEITGDNGVRLMTKQGYKPPQPLVLQPNVPTMVDIQTISRLFDVNSFEIQGITAEEIFRRNGLPEGNYQFCVRVYNYIGDQFPLSPAAPAGCTQIRLTQLEPPLLVKPLDKTDQSSGEIQNLLFTWNIPPGAEPGTEYLFRVIEMLDPARNPNDAVNSRTSPVFFETRTSSPFVLYGPGQPALVNGRRYAWYVTALQGRQGVAYRNGGRSEVRSFFYKGAPVAGGKLTFINPNAGQAWVGVNNENDFLVSWNWLNPNAPANILTDTTYRQYGVTRYDVEFVPGKGNTQKAFSYKKALQLPSNGILPQSVVLTEQAAYTAGFRNGQFYRAIVRAYNRDNQLVQQQTSVDFEYRSLTDAEPVRKAKLSAVIKYSFEGKQQQYAAGNTVVAVEALRLAAPGGPAWEVYTFIDGKKYVQLATASATTKADGSLETELSSPQKALTGDSIYFRAQMTGAYYYSAHFKMLAAKVPA
ncbi:MAG: hypothetical protein ABW019_00515, partial [Chitinophagaceae bacterium]